MSIFASVHRFHKAFTLIEVLSVVFVVGLIVAMVSVNIERDDNRLAEQEAIKFASLIQHVQDESIIHGVPFGISISSNDGAYEFLTRIDQWQLISDDDVLRRRFIPEGVRISIEDLDSEALLTNSSISGLSVDSLFELDASSSENALNELDNPNNGDTVLLTPDILVEPTGLVAEFIVSFFGDSHTYDVKPDSDQNIVVRKTQ